jgi:hypothetical protein
MRRYVPVLIAGLALVGTACRDAVAPTRPETSSPSLRSLGDRSYSYAVGPTEGQNAQTVTFDILPQGGTVQIGEFSLEYEANSVCDPETSGYGPDTWTTGCSTLRTPITITAKFWTENGHSFAEYSPDIRFSPDKEVVLSVQRPEIIGLDDKLSLQLTYGVWYTRVVDGVRQFIDEGWTDLALYTHFDTETGVVRRKIRHFSGYVVHTGYCEENPEDPACIE